jgi:hypothetical protein
LTQATVTEALINANDGMTVKTAILNFLWSEHSWALSPLAKPPANTHIFFSLLLTKRSVISVISHEIPCENGVGMHDGRFGFDRHRSVMPVTLL